jgi:hypothetical protein
LVGFFISENSIAIKGGAYFISETSDIIDDGISGKERRRRMASAKLAAQRFVQGCAMPA